MLENEEYIEKLHASNLPCILCNSHDGKITSALATRQGSPLTPCSATQPRAVGETGEHKGHGHQVVHHGIGILAVWEISQLRDK